MLKQRLPPIPMNLLTGLLIVVLVLGDASQLKDELLDGISMEASSAVPLTESTKKTKRHHSSGRQRRLQGFQFAQEMVDYGNTTVNTTDYNNIRIRFLTEPLESLRGSSQEVDGTIDTITSEILPAVSEQWSRFLSVSPAQGPIPVTPTNCGIRNLDYESLMPYVESGGADNADLVIAVFLETGAQECTSLALAFAFPCTLDQMDRPVFGVINFCKVLTYPTVESQVADATLVATHEVAHVLGQDSSLFKYFRDSNGEPLTPRPFTPQTVTCVDGSEKSMMFPSDKTLKMGQSSLGLMHYELVTPRVATVVRNHFDCQSLDGARLENQPTADGDCSGTHWDERMFFNELMSAIIELGGAVGSNVLSPLSLALMEDTGWYRVSYDGAQALPFGQGRGCSFVEQDCIVDNAVPDYGRGVFCDKPLVFRGEIANDIDNPVFCNPSHTSLALCDLFDRATAPSRFGLGDKLSYFSNPNLVSSSAQPDYCPLTSQELDIECTDENTEDRFKFYEEESYGSGSRCVNAVFDGMIRYPNDTVVSGTFQRAACLPITCDRANFRVILAGQVCEYDYQLLDSARGGNFECPRLATVCPELFCPGGCSGRGVCNYQAVPPRCDCFDSDDLSPLCIYGAPASSTLQPTTPPLSLGSSGVESAHISLLALTTLFVALVCLFT